MIIFLQYTVMNFDSMNTVLPRSINTECNYVISLSDTHNAPIVMGAVI